MTVKVSDRGPVRLIEMESPPVNALGAMLRMPLMDAIRGASQDDSVGVLLLLSSLKTWCAGADIKEFGLSELPAPEASLNAICDALDACPKPVIAAVDGVAFGGGLELALACDYRAVSGRARFAFPEVNIGLLPGAGGTQRTPRLVGVEQALRMCLDGKPVKARRALEMGLADRLLEDELTDAACAYAEELLAAGGTVRKISSGPGKLPRPGEAAEVFAGARQLIARRMRGRDSPELIVQCIEQAVACRDDFLAGLAEERRRFVRCLKNPQSKALSHVFFAERAAARGAGGAAARAVGRAAVIGCGTMGGGIAMNFAIAGIPVTVLETGQEALERGLRVMRRNFERSEKSGRIPPGGAERCMGLITPTTDYDVLEGADFAVEAVYENLDLKKQIFARLDDTLAPGAIIASNTSYLDIDRMAEATGRPGQVLGMHFFSPANIMRLVEVIEGRHSSPETVATAFSLASRMKKVPVWSANSNGFIGNRMLSGYMFEAFELLFEGTPPESVDAALRDFGLPMGPFQMIDLVGLDLGWRARELAGKPKEERKPGERLGDALCERDRFGQKNGRGIYNYSPGSRVPEPDPGVAGLIEELAEELGYERRLPAEAEEIGKRCMYPLVNIGSALLEEGVARAASDIDIVYVYGYGFPAWRGGPMHYAEQQGLDTVLDDIRGFHDRFGARWAPAQRLVAAAAAGRGFGEG
ncbi:MAG: 3-hydroxyacyl-CoA dehydrogenase [Gammaproteobacteria bacterium]|nr:3-hydroxyacyl-CoA dehydrogenase [Gammaproteobacteria bacterium]MYF66757.1 3-hydroxyacyl-CoA dehydrogenase [Gammaproteobacteria bacterium]MYK36930.1 3-hydroxyacyl-CoA dehydrogenase [Gammaproteobacteria bacterium]